MIIAYIAWSDLTRRLLTCWRYLNDAFDSWKVTRSTHGAIGTFRKAGPFTQFLTRSPSGSWGERLQDRWLQQGSYSQIQPFVRHGRSPLEAVSRSYLIDGIGEVESID